MLVKIMIFFLGRSSKNEAKLGLVADLVAEADNPWGMGGDDFRVSSGHSE